MTIELFANWTYYINEIFICLNAGIQSFCAAYWKPAVPLPLCNQVIFCTGLVTMFKAKESVNPSFRELNYTHGGRTELTGGQNAALFAVILLSRSLFLIVHLNM